MADIIIGPLMMGLESVLEYLAEHVITCLIPAFFIAGAIAAFIKKDAILKYFGPTVKKHISYTIAAVSGTVLAVCSCTILPLFAGIYKKGSGIGPATAFLYAGPAINILAIVFTAQVLGYDIGLARAISAVTLSVLIGLIMSRLFKDHDKKVDEDNRKNGMHLQSTPSERSSKFTLLFFALMVAILVIGASGLDWVPKLAIVYLLTLAVAYLLIYHFKKDEVTDWGYETWDLTKKIFPILIAGTFIVGVIAFFLPHATFAPYLGGNSIGSNLFGAIIGAILYMPTLLEVVIIDGTFGFSTGGIGAGPALALLLSGPAVSLPNMIVLQRIMGTKKTVSYIALVVLMSTIAGFTYGMIVS